MSDERRILLMDFVEAYLALTPDEAREYKILGAENHRETTAVWMTWSERMKAEGRKEGLKLGKTEGRKEGRKEGLQSAVRSLRQVLIFQLEQRFGPLPASVHHQVEAMDSLRRLTRLAERVLTVSSLRELRLR